MIDSMQLAWLVTIRHWRVYKKYFWSNILPTFVEPMFFLLSLGIGLGAYVQKIDGISYAEFMAPGLATSAAMFTAFFESSYGFYFRYAREGIYKAMMTTPISPREIIMGELLWVSLKGAVMSTAVGIVFLAFGILHWPQWFILIPIFGFIVGCASGAIGLIASALIKSVNQFQTVYTVVISPLFFFSGILFPVTNLPPSIRWVAEASPLYHGVVLNQLVMWNRMDVWQLLAHMTSLVVFAIVLVGISYRLVFRKLYR